MKSGIYIITCLVNGKVYVGRSKNYISRLNGHKRALFKKIHSNTHLQNAVNKHGIENFTFELLEEYEEEFLPSMENWWCNMLNAHNRDFGFNIEPTSPSKIKTIAKETKEKISASHKGMGKNVPLSEDHKRKISISLKGRKISQESIDKRLKTRGKFKHSKETKIKIGLKSKGRLKSKESKEKTSEKIKLLHKINPEKFKHSEEYKQKVSEEKSINIVQLDLEGNFIKEWKSASEAYRELGIINTSIGKNVNKKAKSAGGFKWMKLEEYNKLNNK